MPGVIPHLIAGCALFFISRHYYNSYFIQEKIKEQYILFFVCIFFSILPDLPLGIYYLTHLLTYKELIPYHIISHIIIGPTAIIIIVILLKYKIKFNREPIWLTGLFAIIIHIIMDIFIPDLSYLL